MHCREKQRARLKLVNTLISNLVNMVNTKENVIPTLVISNLVNTLVNTLVSNLVNMVDTKEDMIQTLANTLTATW